MTLPGNVTWCSISISKFNSDIPCRFLVWKCFSFFLCRVLSEMAGVISFKFGMLGHLPGGHLCSKNLFQSDKRLWSYICVKNFLSSCQYILSADVLCCAFWHATYKILLNFYRMHFKFGPCSKTIYVFYGTI